MSKYFLIESNDPYTSNAVREHIELGSQLRREGSEVTLFLIQDGVLPACAGADSEDVREALDAGIDVLVDDFALTERGITSNELLEGVSRANIGTIVDHLAAGWKVLFL